LEYFDKIGLKIKKISCGGYNFSIFLTGFYNFFFIVFLLLFKENSEVFSVGYNGNGQLGLGNTENYSTIQKIEFFKNQKIIDIQSGLGHSLAINKDGKIIFSCGNNKIKIKSF